MLARARRRTGALLLVLLACGASVAAPALPPAAVNAAGGDLSEARAELADLERLREARLSDEALSEAVRGATALRTRFNQCVTAADDDLKRARANLGKVEVTVSEELRRESADLNALREQVARHEDLATQCRLLAARADDLVNRLTSHQQRILARRLLTRGPDIAQIAWASLREPGQWWETARRVVAEHSGLKAVGIKHAVLIALAALMAAAAGWWMRRPLVKAASLSQSTEFSAQLLRALLHTLARYLPAILASGTVSLYLTVLHHALRPVPFVTLLSYGLGALVVAIVLTRFLLQPVAPARQITPLPDEVAHSMARRLQLLALVMLIGSMIFLTAISADLPEHVAAFARVVVIVILAVNAGWLVWLTRRVPVRRHAGRGLRIVLIMLLATSALAEVTGFNNLALYLLRGIGATVLIGIAFWLASALTREILDGIDTGRREWQKRVRRFIGVAPGEPVPGLIWIRLVITLAFWAAVMLGLLRAWGLSDAGLALVIKYLIDGFTVGGVRVVPSKVILGLLCFALLLTVSRWLARSIEAQDVVRQRLDAGAREALVKIVGYVGFILAVLFALSIGGVDFSNLALVAGALSVGVGFGLQNVVNNFVSGLILLFERPIRTGDWIVVGQTEGHVKRISVRSTLIQTFDRSDVIVPNADLLSNQVTNWTLRDLYGRVILPVGVAYGSDTDLVRRTLLEVANAHPAVLESPEVGHTTVLFRAFGDSALAFELRCYIRDVSERLQVISDLHFAIDKAFRERGISIPFPQRDVHVKSNGGDEPEIGGGP